MRSSKDADKKSTAPLIHMYTQTWYKAKWAWYQAEHQWCKLGRAITGL